MAIPVSQAVKTALAGAAKQLRATITWPIDDTHTGSITSENEIISIKKEAEGYYFASALRKITVVVSGTTLDLLDKRITVTPQVKIAGGTWGNIPWGSFNITEMKRDEDHGITTFIGYGGVARLQNKEYIPGELTFPTTVAGLATELGEKMSLTIETDLTTLPNYDAPIAEDLWAKISGTTYRDILEEIAGATGTMAVISGGNDGLDFILPPISAATDTMTQNNLIEFKIGENWGVANAVVLSRQPQGDNIELVDAESVAETGQRTDVVIANNQILDDQRETTITELLPAVDGWTYRNATLKTEGHGYHEVGDRIDVTIGTITYKTVITKSTITIDGGIKETLISTIPEAIAIDYAKVGGITKTIYNTSLAVDKQQQEIVGIVQRQDTTDAEIANQFTQIRQTLTDITTTVQRSGGGNLLKNSVGYGKDVEGYLANWTYGTGATTTTVTSQSSPASLNAGGLSGHEIEITGATISQVVSVTPGQEYNLSLRAQKGVTGTATVSITNNTDSFVITYPDQQASTWGSKDVTFTPTEGTVTITLTSGANTTTEFTDLMLAQGGRTAWRQSSGEIYNTQVSIDGDGVKVQSSTYTGDYVQITPLEFAGYSNAGGIMKKVFFINRDTTEVEKLKARTEIDMPPLKVVPINSGGRSGWAFVKQS